MVFVGPPPFRALLVKRLVEAFRWSKVTQRTHKVVISAIAVS